MALPQNITREQVERAIAQLDEGASHPFGPSVDYDLVVNGKSYPPKAVVGLAASLATGTQYGPNDFSGGEGQGQANAVLRSLGFEVARKDAPVATPRAHIAPSSAVWLEMTQSSHDHGGPGWEFGTCLWSPSKNRSGHDWYRIMRDPQVGDTVIHCLDSSLVGQSIVAKPCREVQETPPSPGPWEGLAPYYRIDLRDYRAFAKPYPLADLEREYHDEILQDLRTNEPSRYPFFITATGGLRTVQGGYLTRSTTELTRIIVEAVGAAAASTSARPTPLPRRAGTKYWCIAAGEEGRLWPEYQKQQIVTIGWDELGDLRQYPDKERLMARLRETRADDIAPTNDALACYEFVREMKRGDFDVPSERITRPSMRPLAVTEKCTGAHPRAGTEARNGPPYTRTACGTTGAIV